MYRILYVFILMLAADARPLCAAGIPQELPGLAAEIQQAIVVEAGTGVVARVSGWERQDAGWTQILGPVKAVIGRNGLALAGEKREGDGRTPSGTFALRRAFGYEESVATGLTYHQATPQDFWIDDSSSLQYNQWVAGRVPEVSHEALRRNDGLYKYAIVIEYNTDPVVPGLGSAIFLHVWRARGKPTAGCVAVAEADLLRFLHWLDARRDPVIILKEEP